MSAGRAKRLDLQRELAFASRRFNAWWEGYAFDAKSEREALVAAIAPPPPLDMALAEALWGDGRLDPGDASWTLRGARALGLGPKARVIVLGAGLGGPLRDLASGARWRARGFAETQWGDVASYGEASMRLAARDAQGALSFFELHRATEPGQRVLFAAERVKENAPAAFIDFVVARKGVRLRPCFNAPWDGWPKSIEQTTQAIEQNGFRVADHIDETRAFLPHVARGWSRWRAALDLAHQADGSLARAEAMGQLSVYARLWAERFDAMKAGLLQVVRFQARRNS
jgi:hypothetical protein